MSKTNKQDARIGNKFWEARSSHGRSPKFPKGNEGADKLWKACCEYFDWVHDNPLEAAEAVKYEGEGTVMLVPKMQAMTIQGLCLFLDVSFECWRGWKTKEHEQFRKDLLAVITRAEAIIYQQKFTGAAANMLNPNIIARDLGLADKKELTGKDGDPIQTITTIELVAPSPHEHSAD